MRTEKYENPPFPGKYPKESNPSYTTRPQNKGTSFDLTQLADEEQIAAGFWTAKRERILAVKRDGLKMMVMMQNVARFVGGEKERNGL
ncbi:unnamed protein product [Linum trigynum]|uniref:Uncharacterized protein n=1 Tax=Linum trigynum TaxID=586398 RepID=A0AAV2FLC0_9ROSI